MSAYLFFGGDIYTVDDAQPTAEAVAERDGIIVAVGSRAECRAALGSAAEEIDLRGATLMPSFIDTHLHPLMLIYYDRNVNLRGVSTLAEVQERLRQTVAQRPVGEWIVGLDFDEQELAERRLPTRHDLDAVCADRPVVLVKHDGHMVIANTAAMLAAGIHAATDNPSGGVIDREPDGHPAGPFREMAASLIHSAMPLPSLDDFAAGATFTATKLASQGITSVGGVMQTGEHGPIGAAGALEVPLLSMLAAQFPLPIYGIVFAEDAAAVETARQTPLHRPEPGESRIAAVKIIADGSFGSGTAFMFAPFADLPGQSGFLLLPVDELYRHMVFAHQAGLQLCIHAIGDAANRTCIDLFDRLLREYPRRDHRHRIEHASVLDAQMIADIARLELICSVSPMFVETEKGWLHRRLGAERARWTYPFRSLLNAGVKIVGASDGPVETTDVLSAMQAAVTRGGFETQERISVAEAVRMYTIDAAYAHFEEQVKGSVTVGKRADLVVLNRNPLRVAPDEIGAIRVNQTWLRGQRIFDRAGAEQGGRS